MKILLFLFLSVGINICVAQNTQVIIKPSVKGLEVILETQDPYVDVEGYDGDDIIVEMIAKTKDIIPQEAAGLKLIPTGKTSDDINKLNTNVQENSIKKNITVKILRSGSERIKIKVPQNPSLTVYTDFFGREGKLHVKNFNNHVGIWGWIPVIELNHIPSFIISTGGAPPGRRLSDKIILTDIQWNHKPTFFEGELITHKYTIGANSASIDISIPDSLKASIIYRTTSGKVFSEFGTSISLTPELQKLYTDPFYKNPEFKALLLNNGGGINLDVHSQNGNIYFRKQK